MSATTYLISGANRGIGRGLAEIFLERPNTTLVALVRDPSSETSQSLSTFQGGAGSKTILIQYDASLPDSATTAIHKLQETHNITSLDIVIANSGFIGYRGSTLAASTTEFLSHLTTNTVGPILLLSAALPLLKASAAQPAKFFAVSSAIGSTALIPKMQHVSVVPYGMSKAALNHAMLRLSLEHPDIVVEMLTPGAVRTGLGSGLFTQTAHAPTNPNVVPFEKSVPGLVREIDRASKETSGRFFDWKGDEIPW